MAYLPGPLCFLKCDNKGLGGSHNGHTRSPFFPASRQSGCLLLKTDTGLTFRSLCSSSGYQGRSGSGRSRSQGAMPGRRPGCCKRSPHPAVPRVASRRPPTSSSVSTEEKSSSRVPRTVQGQAGLQKQQLYLQKPRVWLVTAEVTPLSPLVDPQVAPSLPRILQVQVHGSFC